MATRARSQSKSIQGEALIRKNSKRARGSSSNEPREPTPVAWTANEKKDLECLKKFEVYSTRFADRDILEKMGLLDDVDAFCESIGMGILARIDVSTYAQPVRHLLATVTVDYEDPNEKIAAEGMLRFKVDDNEYALSIFDVCEAYGFAKTSEVRFQLLYAADLVWKTVADRSYESRSAKMRTVRNPVIRYVCKLLANTFFARHVTGAVNMDEVCFIYQGIKRILRNREGNPISDDLGNDINYGAILATKLVELKSWARTAKKKYIWIGGFLTPLLQKAGVDLSRYEANARRNYLDRQYLITNWFLKGGNKKDAFFYKLIDANKNIRTFKLPNTARTTILGLENVKFQLVNDEFHDAVNREAEVQQQQAEYAPMEEQTDDLYGLNAYNLPEIDFTPKTNREKLIHKAYTMQRAINKIQKKLFAKIFRKIKKLQPPNYVSSNDEEEEGPTQDAEMDDEETQSDEEMEHRTKTRDDRPASSHHT